ncbi:tumor necrosis factor receptor superfamily member 1A [Hypanus sabinus]|uniref:tumor necrosis factor receptor superfamily member 1A n=1 Tax=Hypanus sabinus TaxID=79690 RepID=UPI0028C43986|nr:tumor necrosis factor receptor superfamily member 1A [Hypanus sabinus]
MDRREGAMKGELMATLGLCLVLCMSAAPVARSKRETSQGCATDQFWNEDLSKCLECSLCEIHTNTPGCDACPKTCEDGKFWNNDNQQCISCEICKSQPKTPQCDLCSNVEFPTTEPEVNLDLPLWIWIVIILVFVVSVPIGLAWYKSKEFNTSAVAKPVQEIGTADAPNQHMLASD